MAQLLLAFLCFPTVKRATILLVFRVLLPITFKMERACLAEVRLDTVPSVQMAANAAYVRLLTSLQGAAAVPAL